MNPKIDHDSHDFLIYLICGLYHPKRSFFKPRSEQAFPVIPKSSESWSVSSKSCESWFVFISR